MRPDRPSRPRRRAYGLIALYATAALVFVALTLIARLPGPDEVDVAVTLWIQQWRSPWLTALMFAISWPGYSLHIMLVLLVAALGLIAVGRSVDAIWLAGAQISAGVNVAAKLLIHRPRPTEDLVWVAFGLFDNSFPSGHVVMYASLFGFAIFLLAVHRPRSPARTVAIMLLALPIVLVGISRVYLGQHWISDVFGGYALAILLLVPYCWAYTRFVLRPRSFGQPLGPQNSQNAASSAAEADRP